MTSTRQNKVSRLIQKELGIFFQRESSGLFRGKMITVTTVRVTADLRLARIYLSVFPSSKDVNPLIEINENAGKIKHDLGNRIRYQVRTIPELVFHIDDSLDYVENIDRLLKK